MPKARILTFGYDAYVARISGSVSTNRVADHSRDLLNALVGVRETGDERPILFVAHSLGGLVIKDALRLSRDSPELNFRCIYRWTRGIAFLGTPHAGSWLANWAKIPVRSLGLVRRIDSNLLAVLQTDSEVLYRIQDGFLTMLRDRETQQDPIMVTCFYETLPMFGSTLIVEQQSGIIMGWNRVSVHANHRNVARFDGAQDSGFISIAETLRQWYDRVPTAETPARSSAVIVEQPSLSQVTLVDPVTLKSSEAAASFQSDHSSSEGDVLTDVERSCLQTLAFPEMGQREIAIDKAARSTCEWIFKTETYQLWADGKDLEKTHGLLWIKGKPGSGKSTLMKHAVKRKSPRSKGGSKAIRLTFFFNARGAEIERSPLGLYRTLLFQLCSHDRRSRRSLLKSYKQRLLLNEYKIYPWTLPELRELFHEVVVRRRTFPIEIFIDALDECNDEEVRVIVRSLEESSIECIDNDVRLSICMASRHYPHISVKNSAELFMESMNEPDIVRYVEQQVENSLVLSSDPYFKKELAAKSRGVFLWIVLVVRQLSKAADQGKSVENLKFILQRTPGELHALFKDIFATLDPGLRAETRYLVRLVLFSAVPLTLKRVQVLCAFGLNAKFVSINKWRESLHGLARLDSDLEVWKAYLKLYLTERSGGLFEAIASDESDTSTAETVQVIHESVRDFLLNPTSHGLFEADDARGFAEQSNYILFETCSRILHAPELNYSLPRDWPKAFDLDKHMSINLVTEARQHRMDSWVQYAIQSAFHHLEMSNVGGATVPLSNQLLSLVKSTYKRWMTLGLCSTSIISQAGSVQRLFREIGLGFGPDQIFFPEDRHCIEGFHDFFLQILDDGVELEGITREHAFIAACHHGRNDTVLKLLEDGCMVDCTETYRMEAAFRTRKGHTGLAQAVQAGHESTVKLLLRHNASTEPVNEDYETPIFTAVRQGHIAVVAALVEFGANIDATDLSLNTPIYIAIDNQNIEMIKALIGHGVDLESWNVSGAAPLLHAVDVASKDAVIALLDTGANIEAADRKGRTPLLAAIRAKDLKMIELLISRGANPKATDRGGRTALGIARAAGIEKRVPSVIQQAEIEKNEADSLPKDEIKRPESPLAPILDVS